MERQSDDRITIRELAELAGTTTRTIHYYASEGLLPPPQGAKRGATYTPAHLARLRLIAALRDEGLSLAAIRNRIAPLDDTQVMAVIDDITAGAGDEVNVAPVTTLGAIEAALAARLSSVTGRSDFVTSMDESAPTEGVARMDVPTHASAIATPASPALSARPRLHDHVEFPAAQVPHLPQSDSAKDYIDRFLRSKTPDSSTSPSMPVPLRRVPPPHPAPPPRATKSETPEAWFHFSIGDGIELRVREDRYRESGGRMRAIVDAATSAAKRYGLAPPEDSRQSKPD